MMRGPGLLGGLLGGFLMLLFLIAAAALVVWLVMRFLRSTSSRPVQSTLQPPSPQADPVLETLRRRLADGAITAQEFDELRLKLGV
jgi:uncharacterized membrane protein